MPDAAEGVSLHPFALISAANRSTSAKTSSVAATAGRPAAQSAARLAASAAAKANWSGPPKPPSTLALRATWAGRG